MPRRRQVHLGHPRHIMGAGAQLRTMPKTVALHGSLAQRRLHLHGLRHAQQVMHDWGCQAAATSWGNQQVCTTRPYAPMATGTATMTAATAEGGPRTGMAPPGTDAYEAKLSRWSMDTGAVRGAQGCPLKPACLDAWPPPTMRTRAAPPPARCTGRGHGAQCSTCQLRA